MSRKKVKTPRLPNGFGSIRKLSGNRTNPYAVHPPATERDENGRYLLAPAICYVSDWYIGFAVLNAWHSGTYKPGDELVMQSWKQSGQLLSSGQAALERRILSDFSSRKAAAEKAVEKGPTYAEVYEMFFSWKFTESKKHLSQSAVYSYRAGFKNSAVLHDRIFSSITQLELQQVVDDCTLGYSSLEHIVNLYHQMYKYALARCIVDVDRSTGVTINIDDDTESGVPFTYDDLKILWEHQDMPDVEMVLIMCYSGFRITAYKTIVVDLENMSLFGGVKTRSSKERTVPIHSCIQPLVRNRMERYGCILPVTPCAFRKHLYKTLASLGIEFHTPHDCRHTFSMLLEKYGVSENDRKRMMGHSFGKDITNKVYGHRTLEDLRAEIEKISNDFLTE